MSLTVKRLAKISGVSARTLRHYDEIGLLKPAYYGENRYRYYEEEQLLLLQQILFYRELGFPLSDIANLVKSPDFDKIKTLQSHKEYLNQSLLQTKNLIKTIDKTIAHLRGEQKMKNEEFYYGFDSEKQQAHEKYLVTEGIVTQELMDECSAKIKKWSVKQKNQFIQEVENIMEGLICALEKGLDPSDEIVQDLMQQHYAWLKLTWTPTKESYVGLMDIYKQPDFAEFYTKRHPDLLEFILRSMKVFSIKL